MKISELSAKLAELDNARGEALEKMEGIRTEIRSELTGLIAVLDGVVERSTDTSDEGLKRLDVLFRQSGLSFSPAQFAADIQGKRLAADKLKAELLPKYPEIAGIDALGTLAGTIKQELLADRQNVLTLQQRRHDATVPIAEVLMYAKAKGFEPLTKENLDKIVQSGGWFDRTFNNDRYMAIKVIKMLGGVDKTAARVQKLDTAKADYNTAYSAYQAKETRLDMVTNDANAYSAATSAALDDAGVRAEVTSQIKKALDSDAFVDAYGKSLHEDYREGFLEAVVKIRGLQRVHDYLNAKIDDLTKQRSGMSSTLSKLRTAVSRGRGSDDAKGVKVTGDQLDKAAAATRIDGAYVSRNARAATRDTMAFTPTSSTQYRYDSGSDNFLLWWLLYNQFLFSHHASADHAFSSNALGVGKDNAQALGLEPTMFADLKPDYSVTLTDVGIVDAGVTKAL
ncbi:MAG: hypothetical protein KGQ41_08430, partial [Alphaproteobacteria bacterium]|nr:hypothetical protein [Alphaproteobacteria bacterium]